jgi:hypothetical protein
MKTKNDSGSVSVRVKEWGCGGCEVLVSRNAEEEENEGARPGVCELVGWGFDSTYNLIPILILILQPKL